MTLARVRSWVKQVSTMLAVLNNISEQIDELKAHRELSNSPENKKQLVAIDSDMERAGRDYGRMEKALLEKLNVANYERALEVVTDVNIRLKIAEGLFETWRKQVAALDFMSAAEKLVEKDGEDSEGSDKLPREEMNKAVEDAKSAYEIQLELVNQYIPDKVVLL